MNNLKKERAMSMLKITIILLPIAALAGAIMMGIYYLIYGTIQSDGFFDSNWFLILAIGGVIVHEAIHVLTWMKLANLSKKHMTFGFAWKSLTPYAHSKVPMPKKAYVIGAYLPGILLGVIPYIIGLMIASPWVIYFGIIFTIAAVGDAWVIWMIRDVDQSNLIQDHPTKAGCYIIEG